MILCLFHSECETVDIFYDPDVISDVQGILWNLCGGGINNSGVDNWGLDADCHSCCGSDYSFKYPVYWRV